MSLSFKMEGKYYQLPTYRDLNYHYQRAKGVRLWAKELYTPSFVPSNSLGTVPNFLGLILASMNSGTIQEKVSHFLTGMNTFGAFRNYLCLLLQKSELQKS